TSRDAAQRARPGGVVLDFRRNPGGGSADVDAAGCHHPSVSTSTPLPKVGAPATRALTAAGYQFLEDLDGQSRTALLALHGVGPRAIRLLDQALAELGLSLVD